MPRDSESAIRGTVGPLSQTRKRGCAVQTPRNEVAVQTHSIASERTRRPRVFANADFRPRSFPLRSGVRNAAPSGQWRKFGRVVASLWGGLEGPAETGGCRPAPTNPRGSSRRNAKRSSRPIHAGMHSQLRAVRCGDEPFTGSEKTRPAPEERRGPAPSETAFRRGSAAARVEKRPREFDSHLSHICNRGHQCVPP